MRNNIFWTFCLLVIIQMPINEIVATNTLPHFYSFSYTTSDSDSDGFDDLVEALFDPDYPEGGSGNVTIVISLLTHAGNLIHNVSENYFINGTEYDYFTLDIGSHPAGQYFLFGELYYNSTLVDTKSTSTFRLGLLPYFYDFNYRRYDSDDDDIYDSIKVDYDPDFPSNHSGSITVIITLYSAITQLPILNISSNHMIEGYESDTFIVNLGEIKSSGGYYIIGELIYEAEVADIVITTTFRLGMLPFFYDFDYITYDSDDDWLDDGVNANFDPDFPSGHSGYVNVFIDLYTADRILIYTVSDKYYLDGNDYDDFSLDLGTVNVTGEYYLLGELVFNQTSSDIVISPNFTLYSSLNASLSTSETTFTGEKTFPSLEHSGHKRGETKSEATNVSGFDQFSFILAGIFLTGLIWRRKRYEK